MAQVFGASSYGDATLGESFDPGEFWRVTPPDSVAETYDGTPVVANLLVSPPGAFVAGETATFEFTFVSLPHEDRLGNRERHEELRRFERTTDAFVAETDTNHRPWFREQHGRDDRTAVVGIQPPD